MPRISDNEDYLNANMVNDGDIVKILDPGEFRDPEDTGFSRTTFSLGVELPDGRGKIWTMNKTTQRRLAAMYGDETENWVFKYIRIQILSQNVRGEVKSVLYGYPSEPPMIPPVQAGLNPA